MASSSSSALRHSISVCEPAKAKGSAFVRRWERRATISRATIEGTVASSAEPSTSAPMLWNEGTETRTVRWISSTSSTTPRRSPLSETITCSCAR